MRISLDWLKDYVDVKGGPDKVQQALTMTGLEVTSVINIEKDHIMDIEITPNRPDCLSVMGVARELAAAIDSSLKVPASIKKAYMKKGSGRGSAKVEVLDKKACPRYVGCIIKNVKVGPSPQWLVERLNAVGVRSVNNIVDITNYVLFETGQPLHAFDLDKLEGGKIIVRKTKKGESIVAIDGVKRELEPGMLIIADANSPVAIAGIMGGKHTEISEKTKTILLESAYFDPVIVRKAQRKLSLASESSYRFERGVDFGMILAASVRAQEMIKEIAGGRLKGTLTDVGGKVLNEKEIELDIDEIPRVLGIEIISTDIMDIFKRLDLNPVKKGKSKILVRCPSYRQDLENGIDLIEEIARLYGYDKIPSKIPEFTIQKTYEEEKKSELLLAKELKNILCSLSLNEIVTYTLASRSSIEALGISLDGLVRLQNPLSSNQEFMRPSLISEMLEVVSWNLNRGNSPIQLFEMSKIYLKGQEAGEVSEKMRLSIGMCGSTKGNWKDRPRDLEFFDLKGVVETFLPSIGIMDYKIEKAESFIFRDEISICIKIDKDIIGVAGEVKPSIARKFGIKQKVYLAEIDMEKILQYAQLQRKFMALPRYPSIKRDISILVDDSVSAEGIFDLIKKQGNELVRSVDVFDLYKGQQIQEGKKSLAYTVEYRSDEKTLKDEEVIQIHKNIQDSLVKELGAQIR
ncbi:MAG: phenylalanine--tRNA ligase subunit beta [Candidatus Gorgyraea atricola]|nr:phenylalanine--tRNA ligase subunit beta [Candidatus Gorgyraea atricola]